MLLGVNGPGTNPSTFGPGEESALKIPGSYAFDGAAVTCYYSSPSTSQTLYSVPALLSTRFQNNSVIICVKITSCC